MKEEKATVTSINTRYPDDLLNELRLLAKEHDRSLHGEILHGLREYVERMKKQKQGKVTRGVSTKEST